MNFYKFIKLLRPDLLMGIENLLLYSTFPGLDGGIVNFIYAIKKGHYSNNKYIAKFSIEVFGAMITASCLTTIFFPLKYRIFLAFCIGISWAAIIQIIRVKTTHLIENKLKKIK